MKMTRCRFQKNKSKKTILDLDEQGQSTYFYFVREVQFFGIVSNICNKTFHNCICLLSAKCTTLVWHETKLYQVILLPSCSDGSSPR